MHFLVPFHYAILGMQFMEVSTPHTTYSDALYIYAWRWIPQWRVVLGSNFHHLNMI